MFAYDTLFLLCCCLGFILIVGFIIVMFYSLGFNGKRQQRGDKIKQKLEEFKKKNSGKYGKTSSNKPSNNAEDAEFREVTKN